MHVNSAAAASLSKVVACPDDTSQQLERTDPFFQQRLPVDLLLCTVLLSIGNIPISDTPHMQVVTNAAAAASLSKVVACQGDAC
jgi:hypothetical protein